MLADSFQPITVSWLRWRRLVRELARRGEGSRESGAFLLARKDRSPRRVAAVVFFDDIDPDALDGSISIRGARFGRLWSICSERGMRVIADVHTHPGAGVRQSSIDVENPMVAIRGHVAIILPDFARRSPAPAQAGVHVYQGGHTWESCLGADAIKLLRRTLW